jgi:glucose/arabinose dehydrogenase
MSGSIRAAVCILLLSTGAWAQTPNVVLNTVVTGLNQPVYFTHARDGSNRTFVIEQPGRILVMQPGSATTAVFLDIRSRILSGGERGLLGLAFHPLFSSNRRFFVNYTRQPDGATVIAEFRVPGTTPNIGDPASETILLVIPQPFSNHNGGMIEFGPDNLLYIGMGDGGSGNDPENRAQNLNELLGKILRIDVDRPSSSTVRYSAPSSNPFAFSAGRDEIFAYGLRNPWRFSFDRLTGQLYAGDVGQSSREEIDIIAAGGNYGWRVFEGNICTNLGPASCVTLVSIAPVAEYTTGQLGRCSVTGGYVYRGSRRSLPYGAYVYADYCSGEIFILQNGVSAVLLDTSMNISSFGEDEAGEIYVVNLGGSVHKIAGASPPNFSQRQFSLPTGGGLALPSNGAGINLSTGYTRIQADPGNALPHGVEIFGLRQGGVLISEASVPASPLVQSGRTLALADGMVNTGMAIANPGTQPVTVDFYFTDGSGLDSGQGATTIPAGGQVSAFLNQAPFNGSSSMDGTFTFSASGPVSALALKGLINSRSEFLMTTLPVAPLATGSSAVTFPHWAHGGGWITEFDLVNPTDQQIAGSIELSDSTGQAFATLSYVIPRRSSRRLTPPPGEPSVRIGSARIVANVGEAPSGIAIFRLTNETGIVAEAGVLAVPTGSSFRGYAELFPTVRTGLAVANLSASPATVTVELTRLDGTGAIQTGTIDLPAAGHRGLFIDEITGLTSLAMPFQGIMRVTSATPIAITALRSRINERGDFLISASAPTNETTLLPGQEAAFPHFAVGGGYDIQFILFNSQPGGTQSGTLSFFSPNGQPVDVMTP